MKTIEARPKALLKPLILLLFTATALYFLPVNTNAQICAGSNLRYVVRDEMGKVIDPSGIYAPSGKGQIDELKEAQKVIKGAGNNARIIRISGMCNFREPVKVTLKYKGKIMALVFRMPKFGEYESRDFLVDSLPFRAGIFEIDLSGPGQANPAGDWLARFYPAKGWKLIKAPRH
jgi:hypothetical protein